MQTSDQVNEIAAALAKAQGAIENPGRDAVNPHFRSKYADLASGLVAIKKGLSDNGIAIVQVTYVNSDNMMLETRLIHSSGQWITSHYPVCKMPANQQQMGSALTYARRYSLFALVGIAGSTDDDDGNDARRTNVGTYDDDGSDAKRTNVGSIAVMTGREVEKVGSEMEPAESFDPSKSNSEAMDIVAIIKECDTIKGLRAYAASVKSTKDKLQPADSMWVVKEYKTREAEIYEMLSKETV